MGDAGHELPPAGLSWGQYVAQWVADCGGWLPLADALIARVGTSAEIALDPQTVERGLRRLARREHKPGGQYGRWMVRAFGFASPVETWVMWMGQYHTRFSDLPSPLRIEQLTLWNRPPVAESKLVCWLHVGLAAAHRSRSEMDQCEQWLARAERHAERAGAAAVIEGALLRARLETDAGDHDAARRRYAEIETLLDAAQLSDTDLVAYRARLCDQRAYHLTKPIDGGTPDIAAAKALYEAIPEHPAVPFASFRRSVGLAYCEWQLGNADTARRLAEQAAEQAGDGGLVRMRVMALNMLSRVVTGAEGQRIAERARQMAASLEDDDLLMRVAASVPGPA